MTNNLTFRMFRAWMLLLLTIESALCQNDTSVPNRFQFATDHYFVSNGSTNAVITIQFSPGGRNYQGYVNYSTQDGTAVANHDYVPASGTVYFSGTSWATITVPLTASSSATTNKTILLALTPSSSDPNALISRSNAVLQINLPPPPDLTIAKGPNGTVIISWPEDGTNPFLETLSTPQGASWNVLGPVPVDANGFRCYTDVSSSGMAFYRLRRAQ